MGFAELARAEEKISKKKAKEMFERGALDKLQAGTFEALAEIHRNLFGDIYEFAGKMRTVNLAKGNFRFAPLMYLQAAIEMERTFMTKRDMKSICNFCPTS